MFVRLTIPHPHPGTHAPCGLFCRDAACAQETPTHLAEVIEDVETWFATNLPPPRVELPPRAMFWFKVDAADMTTRIWQLTTLLRLSGLPVQLHVSDAPGRVVYEDDYQVAAVPWRDRPPRTKTLPPLRPFS